MNVALVAYHVDPSAGSEASASAAWVQYWSSRAEQLSVICSRFGMKQPANCDVHVVTTSSRLPDRSAYVMWSARAQRRLRETLSQELFDIIHHVSWGSVSLPPIGQGLEVPLIWGPIGGGQRAPLSHARWYARGAPFEGLRTARLAVLRLSARAGLRRVNVDFALATNLETLSLARDLGARNVRLMLDSAVSEDVVVRQLPKNSSEILWVGRLEPHKAPLLALQAFAIANRESPNLTLTFVGDGSARNHLERRARALQLMDAVRFTGHRPRAEVRSLMSTAGIVLFTSMRDSLGPVILEAISVGTSVVAVDHQGVSVLPPEAVHKVPLVPASRQPRKLADALLRVSRLVATQSSERGSRTVAPPSAFWTWRQRQAEMDAILGEMGQDA